LFEIKLSLHVNTVASATYNKCLSACLSTHIVAWLESGVHTFHDLQLQLLIV